MKSNNMRTVIAGLVTIAVIAVGTPAFAGKGMGCQGAERGYGGCGNQQRQGGCAYGQMNEDLTPEQREQMEAQRQAFFDATKKERQDLYAKRLALKAEMAKSEPDINKASTLQKEASELRGILDQKRLSHVMAMRKINPDAGRGFFMEDREMGRHCKGYGSGKCRRE